MNFGAVLFHILDNKYRVNFLKKLGVRIGDGCLISKNVAIGSEPYLISIGNNVKLSNGVSFVTHDGGVYVLRRYSNLENADLFGRISIGDNVFIGNKATIMPGVAIGNNCIVGYGAIVTKDIPDNSIAVGVPARVVETIDVYFEKNKQRILHTKNLSYEEKRKMLMRYFYK